MTDERAFAQARFARAAFFGATKALLKMHTDGDLDSDRAIMYIKRLLVEAEAQCQPASDALKRLRDDVPLV